MTSAPIILVVGKKYIDSRGLKCRVSAHHLLSSNNTLSCLLILALSYQNNLEACSREYCW